MAGVLLDHVTKKFGEVTAVNDLNIQIRDQEFLVLVGPSGCGKSTVLRMIAGLEEISAGDLYIGDRRVNDVAPKDRDIAMVFQSYALYPHMSVYDNMAFGLKLRKRPKQEIERRVKDAAELVRPTGEPVRGGLHRQPGHELLPRPAGGRERRSGRVRPDDGAQAEGAAGDAQQAGRAVRTRDHLRRAAGAHP